jgi:O-antigen/teichoic acid export membrane protein
MSSRRRVALGMGANVYSQLITIAMQLVSVPLFLSVWDLAEYGTWLAATAVQAYLVLGDFGLIAATSSRVTVLLSRGAPQGANRVVHASATALVLLVGSSVVGAGLLLTVLPRLGVSETYAWVFALLVLDVAIAQVTALGAGVLRATLRNHLAAVSSANARLAEWAGGIAGLLLTSSPVAVAAGMLIGQSLAAGVVLWLAFRNQQDLTLRVHTAAGRLALLYMPASVWNFLIAGSSALMIQGLTLIVTLVLGPTATAVFNIYRTVSRAAVQATSTLSHAAWPEYSRLFGERAWEKLSSFYRRTQLLSLVLGFGATVSLLIGTPILLSPWTRGEVAYFPVLSIMFSVYAFAASTWHVPRVMLTAIGMNRSLGLIVLSASAIGVGLATALAVATEALEGVIATMVAVEIVCAISAVVIARRGLEGPGTSNSRRL